MLEDVLAQYKQVEGDILKGGATKKQVDKEEL